MGNCGFFLCADDSCKSQVEFVSCQSVSPQHSRFEDPSKVSDEILKLRSVNADNKFEIQLHKSFNKMMIRRSLSSVNPYENAAAENNKTESSLGFRRSLTKHKTGIKSSFLCRAKARLRRQTLSFGQNSFGENAISEESTGISLIGEKLYENDFNHLSLHRGDFDPEN